MPSADRPTRREIATLGGGCFWCLEAVFELLRGVERVESGYGGGSTPNPTYREVCDGRTGHAEVVQVSFDPTVISFREVLEVFFGTHDPTTLNRQGADVGTQYRSAIFYHSPEQKQTAAALIAELNADQGDGQHKPPRAPGPRPIVTEVVPFTNFYKAEDYHQEYYRTNPTQPYCQTVVGPKVAKLRQHFADKLRS